MNKDFFKETEPSIEELHNALSYRDLFYAETIAGLLSKREPDRSAEYFSLLDISGFRKDPAREQLDSIELITGSLLRRDWKMALVEIAVGRYNAHKLGRSEKLFDRFAIMAYEQGIKQALQNGWRAVKEKDYVKAHSSYHETLELVKESGLDFEAELDQLVQEIYFSEKSTLKSENSKKPSDPDKRSNILRFTS